MLYDKRWELLDLKYEKVSLRAFIAWLETMPPEEKYNYCDPMNCAVAQFMGASGFKGIYRLVAFPIDRENWLRYIVCGNGVKKEWTFGKALARAREKLMEVSR